MVVVLVVVDGLLLFGGCSFFDVDVYLNVDVNFAYSHEFHIWLIDLDFHVEAGQETFVLLWVMARQVRLHNFFFLVCRGGGRRVHWLARSSRLVLDL